MGLLSAIGRLFKAIFSKLMKLITTIFKKFWWVLLIVAIVWFAPAITAFLTASGAPSFLVSAFSGVATLTPYLQSAVSWLGTTGGAALDKAWTGFKALEFSTQLAVVGGAAALIAPEETMGVISETVSLAGDMVGAVAGAVSSAFGPLLLGAIGLYFLFFREKRQEQPTAPPVPAQLTQQQPGGNT